MKNKLLLGVGVAVGYVLGSRSGRAAYDKLKARAAGVWDSKPVQDKVSVATEAIKEKAPSVADQLGEAARRAGTVLGSAIHREGGSGGGESSASSTGTSAGTSAGAGAGTPATASGLGEDHIPAHSTHPETTNLGTSDGNGAKA
ncbi:type IV secretory pathway TrbL component [Pseudarthrobacter defluvii]|uniref:YtxH domain-containing protein n=1 Tax=Pseudarthrobacter defluvii TaxID=410837 RepID=UPI00278512DD|nr:YtxH domain-containing protein [Pseudarthrobacter defluvii]MDQ0770921.1 type IV secretory pathway TrbL component [Pseudarthrobacter defluvii]